MEKIISIDSILNIRTLLMFLMVHLLACSSSRSGSTINPDAVKLVEVEGNEFIILSEFQSDIEQCIANDQPTRSLLLNLENGTLPDRKDYDVDNLNSRLIVKRWNISKKFPVRLLQTDFDVSYLVCANPLGKVLLTKFLKSSQELTSDEKYKIAVGVLNYRYAEVPEASCLSCGTITFGNQK